MIGIEIGQLRELRDQRVAPAHELESTPPEERDDARRVTEHRLDRELVGRARQAHRDLLTHVLAQAAHGGEIAVVHGRGNQRRHDGVGQQEHAMTAARVHRPTREVELKEATRVEARLAHAGHLLLCSSSAPSAARRRGLNVCRSSRGSVSTSHPRALPPLLGVALVLATLALSACDAAAAQDATDDPPPPSGPFADWAIAVAEGTAPRWTGPRVPWPDPRPRPASSAAARSVLRPLTVHALDEGVTAELAERAREAIEATHARMIEEGWGRPIADGGRGGDDGFDLYLGLASEPSSRTEVGLDTPIPWTALDAATTFATLYVGEHADDVEVCASRAYAEAIFASQDPAEAPAWHRAYGAFVAWLVTGSVACGGDVDRAQLDLHRGVVTDAPESGAAGALWLGVVSARHDGETGTFVRDLWHAARQHTWDGTELRADPDAWHAHAHFLEVSRDPIARVAVELAIARWMTGPRRAVATDGYTMLDAVARAPDPLETAEWGRLPRTLVRGDVELDPFGAAYALVDVRGATEGETLRVWLRAEYGVEWALVAVRQDERGRELGRMRAPVREEPRSYLPVVLTAGTRQVLLVVVNLGRARPDADEPAEQVRGFRLTVDRG